MVWGAIKAPHIFCQGTNTNPPRQHTLDKSSTIPSLHGKFTCYGHGVVSGCFTLRDDDSIRRPFDAPPIVVNYFYHEEVKKSADM